MQKKKQIAGKNKYKFQKTNKIERNRSLCVTVVGVSFVFLVKSRGVTYTDSK